MTRLGCYAPVRHRVRRRSWGSRRGAPDENMDRECQVRGSSFEGCRAPRPAEIPEGAAAILEAPQELEADIGCAMLVPALRKVSGQQVLAAAFAGQCWAMTEDGTIEVDFATFAFARMDDYCYSSPRTPITIAGHRANVCNEQDYSTWRDLIVAAYEDENTKGVLLLDCMQQHPRGLTDDDWKPDRDPERLRIVDALAEELLTRYFKPG